MTTENQKALLELWKSKTVSSIPMAADRVCYILSEEQGEIIEKALTTQEVSLKNCDYPELKAMNDRLINDCVSLQTQNSVLVKALEDGISELSCTCDERFMLDTECPVCRMTKALAAHKAATQKSRQMKVK